MSEDHALDILRDARSILADARLCKGAYAKRANGAECKPTDQRAVSYCALGALILAGGGEPINAHKCAPFTGSLAEARDDLMAVIGDQRIADFNNRWYRTKRGVLKAFDRAIAYREVELPPLLPEVTRIRQGELV